MKCIHCGSEWNVSPGLSVSITNCPFCGKSLLPEKKQLNTVEDVLVEINRLFGVSVLADETKLVAYFSDLAPQLLRQRRILGYFVECGGPGKIVSALNASDDEQSVCIKQIVREMKDEMYIEEAASQMICESFLFAVSGRRVNEISTVSAPKAPLTPVNLATSSQGGKDAMTAEEQYQKGEAYFNGVKSGNSISKDYSKAFEWYQKAALRGHPLAQCQLGLLYREGHGIPKDEKQAFDWFMKAAHANQNCPRGKFYVGRSYHHGNGVQKDYKEAVRWYTMAAQQNDAYAQLNLGSCYEWGEGVSTDYQKAAYWYELSANQGEPLAQCNLGLLYKRGKGVQQDLSKALSLFRESANQGEAYGILQLGICYLEGTGVDKDTVQAFSLLKKAAALGEDVAQFKLAEGFENGTWESEDPAQAFKWYKKAADQGLSSAQVKVGRCYAEGYGVTQNYSEAVYWYQKAADQGNEAAKVLLNDVSKKEITVEQVKDLVKKYNLGYKYFAKGSREFEKKILKAITAYAAESAKESPMLLEDHTIFGSAKEGFVLTANNVYYCLGIGGKGRFPLGRVLSVSVSDFGKLYRVTLETIQGGHSVPVRLSYAIDKQDAEKMALFWRDLLQLNQ